MVERLHDPQNRTLAEDIKNVLCLHENNKQQLVYANAHLQKPKRRKCNRES
jgi:hypothetical protein